MAKQLPTHNQPVANLADVISSGMVRIVDAAKRLRFFIDEDEHVEIAVPCDGQKCAIHIALMEAIPHVMAVEVGNTIVKIITPGLCTRYACPPILKRALKNFDRTGEWGLKSGVYELLPPKDRQKLVGNMTPKTRNTLRGYQAKYVDKLKNGKDPKQESTQGVFKCRPLLTRRISITRDIPLNDNR